MGHELDDSRQSAVSGGTSRPQIDPDALQQEARALARALLGDADALVSLHEVIEASSAGSRPGRQQLGRELRCLSASPGWVAALGYPQVSAAAAAAWLCAHACVLACFESRAHSVAGGKAAALRIMMTGDTASFRTWD